LGDLLDDVRAGFACGDDVENGIIQFRMNNVTRDGAIDWSKIRRVPDSTSRIGILLVRPGDVLFNCTNSPELVGKSTVFNGYSEQVTFREPLNKNRSVIEKL
jgi:type I restriction enzyme S subunit